ncbi:aliphatic sulfonate ABC transporter substrate-binding protein [Shigella flexneri]|nr:aliphatic sulfonate ABC transporter substrate-binding protein [Shigella flexneri]
MRVITLAGSPRFPSRSSSLLEYAREKLNGLDVEVYHWNLQNFAPEDLLYARFDSPALKTFTEQLQQADGLIVATPVYKAAYSGAMFRFLTFCLCEVMPMRNIIKLALAGLLSVSTFAVAAESSPEALRIGYQKGSIGMVLAKSHQLLEKRYPQSKISWVEFPAGPQMLEALNVGSIDLGSTGDIPPIFAQAAGADLVYVGVEPPKPKAEVILVAENSPIKTVADLKGHKVAFQKGSSSHNLLLRALRQAGLKFTDIQPTYLTPADARAAFQQGNVDAWAIWDPYYSAALLQGGVRVLKDGTDLNQTGSFYLAARPYAEKNGAFIQGVLATFSEADALTRSQREQSIALLAKTMGLPAPVIASYLDHRPPTTIKPVNAEVAALQQQTADLFYENRLVPKKVDIRQRIWQPTQLEGKQL